MTEAGGSYKSGHFMLGEGKKKAGALARDPAECPESIRGEGPGHNS